MLNRLKGVSLAIVLLVGSAVPGVMAAEYSEAETELLQGMTGVWFDGQILEMIIRFNTPEKVVVINGRRVPVTISDITGNTVTFTTSRDKMYLELLPYRQDSARIRITDDISKKKGEYTEVYFVRTLGFGEERLLERK